MFPPPGKPHYQCKWPAWYKQSRLGVSLSQCSLWCVQILGYIMALRSYSLGSISHYLIVIIFHIFQKHLFRITKRFVWYNLSIGYLRCNPFLSLFNILGCNIFSWRISHLIIKEDICVSCYHHAFIMIKSKEELIHHCPGLRPLNNDICFMYCYILVIIFVSEHRPPKGESIFLHACFSFNKIW